MKQNLGKIFLLWIVCTVPLWGAYQWKVLQSPKSLMVGQSGVVRYECSFDGSAGDYTIDLKSSETIAYQASILTQDDHIRNKNRIQTFDVRITPKQAGIITIDLEALIRHTTFASIENATIGRDNVKKYDFNDEKIRLPRVSIQVQKSEVALNGSYTLDVSSDTKSVRTHEPLHLRVIVKGAGNFDQLLPYELNISGVKIFSQEPQRSLSPSPEGMEGEVVWEFALVAEKSYTIEPLRLSYFDTEKNRVVTLSSKPIYVDVGEGYEFSSLLDAPEINDYGTLKRTGLYMFFILLGVGLNEVVRWLWKHRPKRKKRYFWDSASTSVELVLMLSLKGEKRFDEVIKSLEEGSLKLGEAKKRLNILTRGDNQ